jgi:DNA-binding transcriptional regulator YdaS (Cro superfamily)
MIISLSKTEKSRIKLLLKRAVLLAGSQTELAKLFGITESAISQMVNGKFLPSARICVVIENKFGIKKEELRPDIFSI